MAARAHTPWALIIIGIVLIVFGIFWYTARVSETAQPEPIAPITLSDRVIAPPADSLDDIEASVQNTEIPEYSKAF